MHCLLPIISLEVNLCFIKRVETDLQNKKKSYFPLMLPSKSDKHEFKAQSKALDKLTLTISYNVSSYMKFRINFTVIIQRIYLCLYTKSIMCDI